MTLKKYPDRNNSLVGRVIIEQEDGLWHLIQIDESGKFHWLKVDEKSDEVRTYYVGCAPHQTKISSELLPGRRVCFPNNRY